MKVVNKILLCETLFTSAMLPYHVHVTHVLDCSYVASLQYNFTISDHSEPIVPYGVMADWLFSAQLAGKILLMCIVQIV